jgi:predicted SnoaL-like aldol condensation-catalyzing enzyme
MDKTTTYVAKAIAAILFLAVLTLCLSYHSEAKGPSTEEENKALLNRLVEEVYNNRNLEVLKDITVPDYKEHTNGVTTESVDAVKQTVTWLKEEAPNFKLIVKDMVADGDKVVMRYIYTGKNSKYQKQVILQGIFVGRIAEGKLVEGWHVFDNLTRYQQLGYTLTPPAAVVEK